MRLFLKKGLSFIYKHFLWFWLLFTVILIYPVLYLDQLLILERSQNAVTKTALEISNKMDGLIQDILQEAYALPINGKSITSCQPKVLSHLQFITLNNPYISGLIISDKENIPLCATLSNPPKLGSSLKNRSLSGPYNFKVFDQPVYLLQQKMGNYFIGILVPSSVLQNALKTQAERASVISLYDDNTQSILMKIEYNEHTGKWLLSSTSLKKRHIVGLEPLQSVKGTSIVVNENIQSLASNLRFSQLLVFAFLLLSSYLMYQLLKKLINQRFSLQNVMKSALKNREFFPVYQPLFNSSMQSYTGVEILLRWQDRDNQLIMPDLFIAEAETTGLIVPITLQILEIAVKDMQEILKNDSFFHLGINISAYHFKEVYFFNKVIQLLNEYSINPSQIIFEITERDLLDINNPLIIDKMTELRDLEFSLAVDDYGTGHASISYLQKFPFNYLKIDKLFVQAIGTQAITESLNDAIIQMAKNLNLILIAEGIESKEQVSYLAENGVSLLQGWYFSRDLNIEQLTSLLKENKL